MMLATLNEIVITQDLLTINSNKPLMSIGPWIILRFIQTRSTYFTMTSDNVVFGGIFLIEGISNSKPVPIILIFELSSSLNSQVFLFQFI